MGGNGGLKSSEEEYLRDNLGDVVVKGHDVDKVVVAFDLQRWDLEGLVLLGTRLLRVARVLSQGEGPDIEDVAV